MVRADSPPSRVEMSIVFVGVACQAPGKKAKERYNLVAAGSTHEVRVSM